MNVAEGSLNSSHSPQIGNRAAGRAVALSTKPVFWGGIIGRETKIVLKLRKKIIFLFYSYSYFIYSYILILRLLSPKAPLKQHYCLINRPFHSAMAVESVM